MRVMVAPKVFVSHTWEDKARFVLEFATRLRERGIDAWLDQWEIQPGDSLVQKIFDEGLHGAAAVIIVLSSNSVNKPWVREEIDASFVQKLTKQTRLIPVIIDECDVPAPVQHLLWVKIGKMDAYNTELDRIVNAIYGQTEKPPLGPAPKFHSQTIPFPGLNFVDSAIFQLVYELIIQTNSTILSFDGFKSETGKLDISDEGATESLQILANQGLLRITSTLGSAVAMVQPTVSGFGKYLSATRTDYEAIFRTVAAEIVNSQVHAATQIADRLNEPRQVVEHVIDVFAARNWLKATKTTSGYVIFQTSPELRRFLAQ